MLLGCKEEMESSGEKGRREMKKRKIKLMVATLNVGIMTGKGREVADLMERRGVDILCVQETRWKGERARCIGGEIKCGTVEEETKRMV